MLFRPRPEISQPGRPELTVPSLLLTTTGRKSGERFIFPLFYGKAGDSYLVIASKGGAPQHPGWYRNILANPEVEMQVGTAKLKARAIWAGRYAGLAPSCCNLH
jgi:proline iminopeptidase